MGIFSRTRDVIDSNLATLLNKADDPEKMARLIIQEMEDTLVEVRSMAVGFLARKKELQRAIDTLGNEALDWERSEEHTSELQSLMRISYAVFCLKKKTNLYTTKILTNANRKHKSITYHTTHNTLNNDHTRYLLETIHIKL